MPLDNEIKLLLNTLIKKHYDYFKLLEDAFDRYLLDQYKHSAEYPPDLPFKLISKIYELDSVVTDYCTYGISSITTPHDACSDMIKYKFWLHYNLHYSPFTEDIVILRFNSLVDKCITILKLNDEIVSINCFPMCNLFSSKS